MASAAFLCNIANITIYFGRDRETQQVKVGDLVKPRESMLSVMGTGIVIDYSERERVYGRNVCVQWSDSFRWYDEEDLEVIG